MIMIDVDSGQEPQIRVLEKAGFLSTCNALPSQSSSHVWVSEVSFPISTLRLIPPGPSITLSKIPPAPWWPPPSGVFHVIQQQHSSIQSLLTITDTQTLLQTSHSTPFPRQQLPVAVDFVSESHLKGHALRLTFPSAVRVESATISAHTAMRSKDNDRLKIVVCAPCIGE
jgi:hypothetical protein